MTTPRPVNSLSRLALYEISESGEVRSWSEAAEKLLGFASSEIIGRHVGERALPVEASDALTSLKPAKDADQLETFGWAVRKDGTRFWANEFTLAILDVAGRRTGFVRILRDATSWKSMEEERDRILKMSGDLIGVAGFDGCFKRINPSFTRVLGYSEAEILQRPFIDFVHPEDRAATIEETRLLIRGERDSTVTFQNRYLCFDGMYRWLEWKSNSSVAEGLIYTVARDITEQKGIEKKIQEKTRELERSNGELQQFAYVASHDLQEPLRAVAGCVQMLEERNAGKFDDRSRELMTYAVDGAKRMQTLINDLLEFSRVGNKGLTKEEINPRLAVDKALRQLSVAIAESDAEVIVDTPPHLWADASQMTQLFQNLIGNALKFRGADPLKIQVSWEHAEGKEIFSIRDNGIGIAPEYHEKIFGLFQRLQPRASYAGTGIGLAICKKIVERHGGHIWVESAPGEGATFRFSIPERTK